MTPRSKTNRRVCRRGHIYYKTSNCPVCPTCERLRRPENFLGSVSAPARRALERVGATTLKQLASFRTAELLALHGFGPSAIPPLRNALRRAGLRFRK